MQQIKIEKRIAEELAGIRKMAAFLPPGKANALLNKCGKIDKYARKAQAMVDAPTGSLFPTPAQVPAYSSTTEDIIARWNAKKEVLKALMAGRAISLENSQEFRTSQMHTIMCKIRREIREKGMPYTLCSREKRPDPKRPGFNEYYLIPKEDE